MALEYTTEDGAWTNTQGENTHPHKSDTEVVHKATDYSSHEVNSEVA